MNDTIKDLAHFSMKNTSKPLIIILLLAFVINANAQSTIPNQNQDSLLPLVKLIDGKVQLNNLTLFDKNTELENLYLEISLSNFVRSKTFVQSPVRIEIERIINGKTERIEIARFFLPWINDKSSGKSVFLFDISAYGSLFKKAVKLNIETNNYIQPLALNMRFQWKNGQAPIKAKKIINLWRSDISGFSYSDKNLPINRQFKPKVVIIPKEIKYAQIKIYLSGWGKENIKPTEAECSKFYFLKINNQEIAKRPIWRDDCSLNSIFPQDGPWTYSRANWCPGQVLRVYDHFITLGTDTTININFQIQEAVNANPLLSNYIISANLILFGEALFKNDAAVVEILSPNKSNAHNRYNPICSSPVIRVRNTGADTLRSVLIHYGLNDKRDNRYRWRGELGFMEEEIVYLPPLNWYFYDHKNKPMIFSVSVEGVNNKIDEYAGNNSLASTINLAPVFSGKITIEFTTNSASVDNILELVDDMGSPLFEAAEFINNTPYSYDLELVPGCYEFIAYDQEGNGIYFPGNKDGKGSLKIIDTKTKEVLVEFEPNFGAEIRQQFMVLK